MVRPGFSLGLLLPTCLLLVLLAAQGGKADSEQLRAQKALLSELEYNNDVLSLKEPWASPSPWLRDWISRAKPYFTSTAQVSLLNELNTQNEDVSRNDPWGSPSAYLGRWVARMRATLQD
ncbi:hypothetical protein VOLCADRAFT_106734 [Volvox carteri f. nagariensis]|uniref:Uncharacterized protein n=1 Tax=Volvox carteri f. nagariensis TaxID=3068 RepID=D8U9D3_VOLCA|nr:uncharacterized protein VOLCADRAFT_106734 [Volvox carteri f. nagariensis]EFJ43619.1 hypothetical protein VOLCADRAFT_106734 [Volvox carteri f. nagariensis]|eukprot:XP_002955319.1 hypothetical protein VOLCADRAFT_106734 [Volvox carteri f. nagariensis]